MNKYTIVFEFRTYFDESQDEIYTQLDFIPYPGMGIFLDESEIKLDENMENKGWFKVEDVDFILKDNVFIVSLKEMGEYNIEE